MSTKATVKIIDEPRLYIHIYEELAENGYPVYASISAGDTYLVVKLADNRTEYEEQ